MRFERVEPNDLWQMDFKGHFELGSGSRCHPLTVLDDHSRYAMVLQACSNRAACDGRRKIERRVPSSAGFCRQRMLMDNGSPWGSGTRESPWTGLTVWMLRLGIRVSHGRPYHPQTQGKEERFHRTLKAEVLQGRVIRDFIECQLRFDSWRGIYNHERPHEALELAVPGTRYRRKWCGSIREQLPDRSGVQRVDRLFAKCKRESWVGFQGRDWHVSKVFAGERVGMRPTTTGGCSGTCGLVDNAWACSTCMRMRNVGGWSAVRKRVKGNGLGGGGTDFACGSLRPFTSPYESTKKCYPCPRTPVTP